jgi:hypothetical protein
MYSEESDTRRQDRHLEKLELFSVVFGRFLRQYGIKNGLTYNVIRATEV